MARAGSTPILEGVVTLGLVGVLAASSIRGDFVVMIAVVAFFGLGVLLYRSLKQDALFPYVFRSEALTLEFLDAGAHGARITTAGEVMANVEGWRVFESGQQLPEGGEIGEIGERYEGLRAAHFKVAAEFSEAARIIRLLERPLRRGRWQPFTHWIDLLGCYTASYADFGIQVDNPIRERLVLTLLFAPEQPHGAVALHRRAHQKADPAKLPFKRDALPDGRVRYVGTIRYPRRGEIYAFSWNW